MSSYPFYIIGKTIIESDGHEDIPHSMLWKHKVAHIVADKYNISYNNVKDLCYAFMRGRVSIPLNKDRLSRRQMKMYLKKGIRIENRVVFFGENDLEAIKIIKRYYPNYKIQNDKHHVRQEDDVLKFQMIIAES